jgi:hypothetical protein
LQGPRKEAKLAGMADEFLNGCEFYLMRIPISLLERIAEGRLLQCGSILSSDYTYIIETDIKRAVMEAARAEARLRLQGFDY